MAHPRRFAPLELAQALAALHRLIQGVPDTALELKLHSEDQASPLHQMRVEMKETGWAKISVLNSKGSADVVLYYERTPDGRWRETRVLIGGDEKR